MREIKRVKFRTAIYSFIPAPDGNLLVGFGEWERDKIEQPHNTVLKDSINGRVRLINREGKIIKESGNLENIVYPLLKLADGKRIMVGCRNGMTYILDWDINILKKVGNLGTGNYRMGIHPKTQEIVIGCRNGEIKFLSQNGEIKRSGKLGNERLWDLVIIPKTNEIVFGDFRGKLYFLNENGLKLQEMVLDKGAIWALEFLEPDQLLVGYSKGILYFLDVKTRTITSFMQIESPIATLAVNQKTKEIFIGGYRGNILKLDRNKKLSELKMSRNNTTPVWALGFVDDDMLAAAHANGEIVFFKGQN